MSDKGLLIEILSKMIPNGSLMRGFNHLSHMVGYGESLASEEGCAVEGLNAFLYVLSNAPEDPVRERAGVGVIQCLKSLGVKGEESASPDFWLCGECWSVLKEPVTLECGHTLCRSCAQHPFCSRCGVPRNGSLGLNAHVGFLVNKYWKEELVAHDFRLEGDRFYHAGDFQSALFNYSKAYHYNQEDPAICLYKSVAHFKLKDSQSALEDAEKAAKLKPYWDKAHYRKSIALRRLQKDEDAIKSLYHCLLTEKEPSTKVKDELVSLLTKINCRSKGGHRIIRFSENFPMLEQSHHITKNVLDLFDEAKNSFDKLVQSAKLRRLPMDRRRIVLSDYDCPLCLRLYWIPVTTPCGHTFCKGCLDRTLDHQPLCALCKYDLTDFLAYRNYSECEFIQESIKRLVPEAFEERKQLYEQEMKDLICSETPIFVCTISFPNIPCPLHVYEPRYRLMIRRCMETGIKQFGMCCPGSENESFAEYGTILEIRDVKYFTDGRSIVNTIGSKRFKVLSRNTRDGYNVARIELIEDVKIVDPLGVDEVKELHDETYKLACEWFSETNTELQEAIVSHFGIMPRVEREYWLMSSGPSWIWWVLATLPLDQQSQVKILSQTCVKERLKSIRKILKFISKRKT